MATYGKYETFRVLSRGGLAVLYSGRRAGGSGKERYVVKVLETPEALKGPDQGAAAREAFLNAARAQQQAARRSGHWARVRQLGEEGDRAYYVSDRYTWSLQSLIQGEVKVDATALHRIALGIVRGLEAMQETCGRTHGALRTNNVLLRGSNLARADVALADPAPPARAAARGLAGDLRALGELIYQLVLHQPVPERVGLAIPDSPAWERLGKRHGDLWRKLCNRLLVGKVAGAALTLEEVRQELAKLRTAYRIKRMAVTAGVALAASLIACGAAWWFLPRGNGPRRDDAVFDPEVWLGFCDAYYEWGRGLVADLEDNDRRRLWRKDTENLAHVIAAMEQVDAGRLLLDPKKIAGINPNVTQIYYSDLGPTPPPGAKEADAIRQTQRAWDQLRRIDRALDPHAWEADELPTRGLLGRIRLLADECGRNGWAKHQESLGGLLSHIHVPRSGSVKAVDEALDQRETVEDIRSRWQEARGLGERIRQAATVKINDKTWTTPALAAFPQYILAEGGRAKDLASLRRRLKELRDSSRQLQKFVENTWSPRSVDHAEFFGERADEKVPVAPLTDSTYRVWMDTVREYQRIDEVYDGQEIRKLADLFAAMDRKLTEAAGDIEKLQEKGTRKAKLEAARLTKELKIQRDGLARHQGVPRIKKNEARLEDFAATASRGIDKLKVAVQRARLPGDPAQWLARVRSFGPAKSSPVLSAYWRQWRDGTLQGVTPAALNADRQRYQRLADRVANTLALLGDLDALPGGLPQTPGNGRPSAWRNSLARIVDGLREQELRRAIAALPTGADVPPDLTASALPAPWQKWRGQWTQWKKAYLDGRSELIQLAGDFGRIDQALDLCYLPDEPLPGAPKATVAKLYARWKGAAPYRRPGVQAALSPVAARVESLAAIPGLSRAQLLSRTRTDRHTVALRALWGRLGAAKPAWPNSDAELADGRTFRQRLTGLYLALPADRQEALTRQLTDDGLGREIAWLTKNIDNRCAQLDTAASDPDGPKSEVLPAAAAFFRAGAAAAAKQADLPAQLAALEKIETQADRLTAFVRGDWTQRVARKLFVKGGEGGVKLADGALPTAAQIDQWRQAAEGYFLLTPDPRKEKDWSAELKTLGENIDFLKKTGRTNDARGFQTRLDALRGKIATLQELQPIRKNQPQLRRDLQAAETDLAKLVPDILKTLQPGDEWYREVMRQAELPGIDSPTVHQAWRHHRDALLRKDTAATLKTDLKRYGGRRSLVERVKQFLTGADRSLPKGLDDLLGALPAGPRARLAKRAWFGPIAVQAQNRRREAALKQLIGDTSQLVPDFQGQAYRAAAAAIRDKFLEARTETVSLLSDLDAIEDRLAACLGPDDGPAPSLATLHDKWKAHAALTLDVRPALKPTLDRVARLRTTVAGDAKALADHARRIAADPTTTPEIVPAVWLAVGKTGWPANLADLKTDRAVQTRLSGVVKDLRAKAAAIADDPARRKLFSDRATQLSAELTRQSAPRWRTCFARLRAAADITEAASLAKECGADLSLDKAGSDFQQLPAAARFNVLLDRFTHHNWRQEKDQQVRDRIAAFGAEVRKHSPALAAAPRVARLLTGLEKIRQFREKSGDLSKAGPAKAAFGPWSTTPEANGQAVTYAWAGKDHRLRFLRIEPKAPGAQTIFLCTTEMSLGLFTDVVAAARKWPDVLKLLPPQDNLDVGPRVWRRPRGTGRIRRQATWQFWPPAVTADRRYPAGLTPGEPAADSPMQRVTPAAADAIAALLACRLPSSDEWLAAYALHGRGVAARWNRRDSTWMKQKQHIDTLRDQGIEAAYPDAGIFWPDQLPAAARKQGRAAVAATSGSDGALWLSPIAAGPAGPLRHLVGNVAELTKNPGGGYGVLGASALSAPTVRPDSPYPATAALLAAGASDVGFRLAFKAPVDPPGFQTERLLASQDWTHPPAP